MASINWIKISTDIFNDEKILIIESLPEADAIIVIWFKLLVLTGRTNSSGVLIMNNRIAYTEDMLATIFRKKKAVIQLALKTFEKLGMIEIINNAITIPNWEKHQNIDGLDKIKEQRRVRAQAYRDKQKLLLNSNVTHNVDVTDSNATEEEEEKEKEKDKEKDKELKKNLNHIIVEDIISHLNLKTNKSYKSTTKKTKDLIQARLNEEFTVDDFKKVIDIKCRDWLHDNKMNKFLRPETLFSNKFEGYLNQQNASSKSMDDLKQEFDDEWGNFIRKVEENESQ